ncbi:MAG: hypothetical protein JNK82_17150 [Myxococcaceae bacterium]|nr:hypothetical protein [Myxococcaceae bacterium]
MKLRASRVILFSSLLGIGGGVVLSTVKAREAERAQARLEAKQVRAEKNVARPKTYELAGKVTYVDPEAVKFLPEYPKAVVTDLAETSAVQGVPMKAGFFMTEDKLEDVFNWYVAELDKARRGTVSQHWGDGAAYIGFYGSDKHMHTVALMRSGSQTYVFLSNSDPEAFLRAAADNKARRPDHLPAPANVSREISFDFDDEGMQRKTYFANAGLMSLDQARTFYLTNLEKLGWKVTALEGAQANTVVLNGKRPGEDLSLTLTRDDKEKHVSVYAHLLHRR